MTFPSSFLLADACLRSSQVKPVSVFVLDASNCEIEYNINNTTAHHDNVTTSLELPPLGKELRVLHAVGHVHIGGESISLAVDGTTVCTSVPRYGKKKGVAGEEAGYVVQISTCDWDTPLVVKKDSRVRVFSEYSVAEELPYTPFAASYHVGVMSLFYVVTEAV